jgi:hypothetical protein
MNMSKCKLIKFKDERGWSIIATDDIKLDELLIGIPHMEISSFDYFPWQNAFKDKDSNLIMIARLVYERLVKHDPTDYINNFVNSLPISINSPLLWSKEE